MFRVEIPMNDVFLIKLDVSQVSYQLCILRIQIKTHSDNHSDGNNGAAARPLSKQITGEKPLSRPTTESEHYQSKAA